VAAVAKIPEIVLFSFPIYMKKLLFVIAVLLAFTITSCERKDYTCTCTLNNGGHFNTQSFDFGVMSRNAAEDKCNDKQVSLNVNNVSAMCKTN
jgi:hypothetical protein